MYLQDFPLGFHFLSTLVSVGDRHQSNNDYNKGGSTTMIDESKISVLDFPVPYLSIFTPLIISSRLIIFF